MKKILNQYKLMTTIVIGLFIAIVMLGSSFSVASSTSSVEGLNVTKNEIMIKRSQGDLILVPTTPPDLLTRTRSLNFIKSTQNVPENNATNIDQIYYRVGAMRILDPTLSNVSQAQKQFWINQILSFQKSSGGFGTWKHDRSTLSSTYKAIQILQWLGYNNLNVTLVTSYLDRLRNSLTNGYNSYLKDTDSDVYSTHLAVLSYSILGKIPPNASDVAQVFIRAQNLGSNVSSIEQGGFGKQSNRFKQIFWTSEITITRAALVGLKTLNQDLTTSVNVTAALEFLISLQSTTGGWVNTYNDLIIGTSAISASHTAAALEAITLLNGTARIDSNAARNFLLSLETPEGGFKLKIISSEPSLKGTFFSLLALDYLGAKPTNTTATLQWLLNWTPNKGGFGGEPGSEPTLRETFDAVYALVLAGKSIPHRQEILNYVNSYRNPDGGFGLTGSYTESTFRAVSIYSLLGEAFPNASQTIAFLQSLQQLDGGFVKKPGAIQSYVISTYRAIAALHLLNATPTDVNGAITFLRQSQNPDGGFKRSNYDVTLPGNVSSAVYTYSAVRGLYLLNSTPTNVSGLYSYLVSLRNADGGFGPHQDFTSNIAYVFTSFWILKNIHAISNFSMIIPGNIDNIRSNYDNFTIQVFGAIGNLNYTVINLNSSILLASGIITGSGSIVIDTSTLPIGRYEIQVTAWDDTLAKVNATFTVLISSETSSPSNTTSSTTQDTTTTTQDTTTVSNNTSTTSQAPQGSNNASSPLSTEALLVGFTMLGGITIFRRKNNKHLE